MKIKFTTNIDKELLQKIKIKAIEENKNVNEIIEEQLKKYLEEGKKMETMFNQKNVKINAKSGSGLVEYNYNYFKEGFEEWARDLKMNLPDTDELKQYLRECGYNVIEIKEIEEESEMLNF